MPDKHVYLSLGTNLGDRALNLEQAIAALKIAGVRLVRRSAIYETEPQDEKNQPWFLNMVIECTTRYFPIQLLGVTQRVERQLGRERAPQSMAKGPRLIDIDILLYGRVVIETPQLSIPHPRMSARRFVLEPLCELDSTLRNPLNGRLFRDELKNVNNQLLRLYQAASR